MHDSVCRTRIQQKIWKRKRFFWSGHAAIYAEAFLPSNRHPTMVSNELVSWMMQGKREGHAQPSVCINTTRNIHKSLYCCVPIMCRHKALSGRRNTCRILICICTNGLTPLVPAFCSLRCFYFVFSKCSVQCNSVNCCISYYYMSVKLCKTTYISFHWCVCLVFLWCTCLVFLFREEDNPLSYTTRKRRG